MSKLGVFDSGVGGLTVVSEIKKRFPKVGIVYLGDTARVPYGPRGIDVVKKFAVEDAKFLLNFDVDAIVVACNTVSALAIDEVRQIVNVDVFEMILFASKKAMEVTKNKKIGVIGTYGTINSHAYLRQMSGFEIYEKACPLLVPFIEEGEIEGQLIENLVRKYIRFVKEESIDTLILGCTHYPLLSKIISEELGDGVNLVNCGEELALNLDVDPGTDLDRFFVTDLNTRVSSLAEVIMGRKIKLEKAQLEI